MHGNITRARAGGGLIVLAYSARSRSRGIVERSQAGVYFIGGFLAGYVPPEVTNLTLHLPWMRRCGG